MTIYVNGHTPDKNVYTAADATDETEKEFFDVQMKAAQNAQPEITA